MEKKKTVLIITLLALILRLPWITGSFWLDEAAQALESTRPLSAQLSIAQDFQPPLFHLIVHFFSLVSHAEWWMRLPSLFAGVATVGLLYLLFDRHFGKRAALWGSVLLATSPFHIFYSQELRPYALAAFFATLSWFFLLKATSSLALDKARMRKTFVYFCISSILGMYTMYLYPFVVIAQLLYCWVENKKQFWTVCRWLLVVGVFFLPWIPSFLSQLQIGTQLTRLLPGWSVAVATPQLKALPLIFAKFFVGQVVFRNNPLLIGVVGLALLFIIGTCLSAIREKKNRFLWYWFLVPIIGSWILSFYIPVIQAKRVLLSLPAVLGLLSTQKHLLSKVTLAVVLTLQLSCLGFYYMNPAIQRENWKELIGRIETQAPKGSAVVFSFPDDFAPWQWYSQKKIDSLSTGKILIEKSDDTFSVSSQLHSVSMVYLFDYLRDLTDPSHTLEAMLLENGFREFGIIDGGQVGFVRIYKKQ